MDSQVPRLLFTTTCLRKCLVAVSIVLWSQGACFLLLGVFIHNFLDHFFTDGRGLKDAGGFPMASIILGIAMVTVALLINYFIVFPTKSRYFLLTFLLMVLFTFEFVFFVAGFEYASIMERVLKEGFEIAMINYNDGFVLNIELNLLQWLLQCCGAEDFRDWYNTPWAKGRMQVPESCCTDVTQCHNLEPVMVDDINIKGCSDKIFHVIESHNIGLIISISFAAVSQILGIILSASLGIKEIGRTQVLSEIPIL